MRAVFITGITGLLGNAVASRLLRGDPALRVFALVRDATGWQRAAHALGSAAVRVIPLTGDVTHPGLGLHSDARRILRAHVSHVIHCAADTSFSRPLPQARAVNTVGTSHVLDVARELDLERFVHVSTAFVAGGRTGRVPESALDDSSGFINAYEQSKYEAEILIRSADVPWVIVRPSTIVCDDAHAVITQLNAVHRALRVVHAGLCALMPGDESSPVDVVTTNYVAAAVTELALRSGAVGSTYHLCAGQRALPLGELLERAYRVWSADPAWLRRGIARPALTSLETYWLFAQSVEELGDARLTTITRSLSHFAPQLALPKHFATAEADAALGFTATPVRNYWDALAANLVRRRHSTRQRRAA